MFEKTEAFIEKRIKTLALVSSAVFLATFLIFIRLAGLDHSAIARQLLYLLVPAYAVSSLSVFYLIHLESGKDGLRGKIAERAKICLAFSLFFPSLQLWMIFRLLFWEPAKRRHPRVMIAARKMVWPKGRPRPSQEEDSQFVRL